MDHCMASAHTLTLPFRFNPFLPVVHQNPLTIFDYFGIRIVTRAFFKKMFEGDMLIIAQCTTLLQIFCEFVFYSEVIF